MIQTRFFVNKNNEYVGPEHPVFKEALNLEKGDFGRVIAELIKSDDTTYEFSSGLRDMHGYMIFDRDVVLAELDGDIVRLECYYDTAKFAWKWRTVKGAKKIFSLANTRIKDIEIVGNGRNFDYVRV